MHAVIVDGDISYPATSGKRLRTLHLMLRLARRHRVTYLARGTPTREAEAYLRDHGIEPILIDDPVQRKSGLLFHAHLAANLLSPLPYSVASHASPVMSRAVQALAATSRVDLWQFEWTPYLRMLDDPRARTVLMAHNVDSLIWQRYYETERQPLKRWYVKQQWRKFRRFEAAVFRQATRVVAVSADDAALVRGEFGMPWVDVVENGIDRAFFATVPPERDSRRVLFLGALDWRPNQDGLALMLDRVFPDVLREEPAARLIVVGRNPPLALAKRIAGLPWAELHADVPDVRPYLAGCGVLAVPLRVGGGSRLKILEGLATETPVVSTRVGAEGLELSAGTEYVAAEIEAMAGALVKCMRQPDEARATAEAGRRRVLERYDWNVLADKLEAVWEQCLTAVPQTAQPRVGAGARDLATCSPRLTAK